MSIYPVNADKNMPYEGQAQVAVHNDAAPVHTLVVHPEQPYPGQPYPSQPYPGQAYPGQPYPGQAYPGQPYPGQAYPGQPYPGQAYPGQQMSGYPQQQIPGYPAQQIPQNGVPMAYGAPAMNQGYYPPASCQHTDVIDDGPSMCGICCAILFFPWGLICCAMMRNTRCAQCGQSMDF